MLSKKWKTSPTEYTPPKKTDVLRRRFLLFTIANAYPGLKSEELIQRFINNPIDSIAPGFEKVNTFSDMRDSALIWMPNLGMGYILSP
ncbi:MAG: hypothetical protein KAH38_10860, partial [Candidatus Hydrogenedentes bacterium]|nr:hypothetical protein [Candidatus Hydrogenedentota bacterium]